MPSQVCQKFGHTKGEIARIIEHKVSVGDDTQLIQESFLSEKGVSISVISLL